MTFKGIIFDLFGTLTDNFSPKDYNNVLLKMSEVLAISYNAFWNHSGMVYHLRETGKFNSMEDSLEFICCDLKIDVTRLQIKRAAQLHYDYVAQLLQPEMKVLDTLNDLRNLGLKIGLSSNCGPDVPALWESSPLSPLIDSTVFSCQLGVRKPDPEMYNTVSTMLGIPPHLCIYVGDGSSEELNGATQVGMYSVLKCVDLKNAYDSNRSGVQTWVGPRITDVKDIFKLFD